MPQENPRKTADPGRRRLSRRREDLASQIRRASSEYSSAVSSVQSAYGVFLKAVGALVDVDRALSRGDLMSEVVGRRLRGRDVVYLSLRIGADLRAKVRGLEVPDMGGSAEEADSRYEDMVRKVAEAEDLLSAASEDAAALLALDRNAGSLSLRRLRDAALSGARALHRFSRRASSRASSVSAASLEIASDEISNFG